MEAMKSEHDQSRKELTEERDRNTQLVMEMEELRLTQGIDIERRRRAEKNQRRAKKERKDMEK